MDQYSESQDKGDDVFMETFKYYKRNKPKPSLCNVLTPETGADRVRIF